MSYKASNAVREESVAGGNARLLLYTLAEIAHRDGVAWATIDYAAGDPEWKRKRSLRWGMGNPDEKTVRRAIEEAQLLDELEVVVAFEGRRRFYVYRILLGALREEPVDYDRGLPRLGAPFWTPEELLLPIEQRPSEGHRVVWITSGHPAHPSPPLTAGQSAHPSDQAGSGDDRAPVGLTTGHQCPPSFVLNGPRGAVRARTRAREADFARQAEEQPQILDDEIAAPAAARRGA